MAKNRKTLFLIDGLAIAYRSFFAFIQRPLTTSDGRNVSAIYGFVTFLSRILSEHDPDYIVVAFDSAEPTFRHEEYEEYKATREKMPEDLSDQLQTLKEVIHAYNIPLVEVPGFEADDIIGTLAKRGAKDKLDVYMVTGDKDFLQLITDEIFVLRPGKQGAEPEIVDISGVKQKFGVRPDQVTDVLALTGDTSDNVPGVPGIGEKTAIPLIQKFGSLDALYDRLEEIPQKGVKKKLTENREKAVLSKSLVTIRTDVPTGLSTKDMIARAPDTEKLSKLYAALEFRSMLGKLSSSSSSSAPSPEDIPQEKLETIATTTHTYHHVTDMKQLRKVVKTLHARSPLVFDTETTSTQALTADLIGISLAAASGEAWFVRIDNPNVVKQMLSDHDVTGIPLDDAIEALRPLLEDPASLKVGHNIKYDMLVMQTHGVEVRGPIFDTMIASYLIRADGQHGMDAVARDYLRYSPITYTDIAGKGKDQIALVEVDPERLKDYACEDADVTARLYELFVGKLEESGMKELAEKLEMPLVSVLARMESEGVSLDTGYLKNMSGTLERTIASLTETIHGHAGGPFNINSTRQLGEILFEQLDLPVIRKTKTGYSTDVNVLEALKHQHPIVESVLEYRQLTKLKSTYVDALPSMVNPRTARVHTSFGQTVAATGRLSSSDPNLQNIPIRTETGRAIRKAFVPADDKDVLLSADYSQIELRIMAHICGDDHLQEAFRNMEDIHTATAAGVFGVSREDVSPGMRRKAKEVNFGIMYGIGAFGLANRLEISQGEAKEIIESYFARYPRVRQYIDDTIATAKKQGYVQTLNGRRRYLPDLNSRNRAVRQNAERQAINMPIQGTAADMIKLAMIRIDALCREGVLKARMLLQVHDELVFECRKDQIEPVTKLVRKEMQEALPLSVPLEVDVGAGGNWLDAH